MLHFEVTGNTTGPTVVFLHAVGIDSWMWKQFLPHIPDIKAVLIDLPGHGGSRDIAWRSLEATAALVGEVVDHAAPEGSHIAALSLGSYVGLCLLAQKPAHFTSGLLSGIHAGGMERQALMRAMSFVMAPLAVRPFFARKSAAMFHVAPERVDEFVLSASRTRTSAFRKGTNDVVAFELPAGLDQVQTKTIFAAGSREHELILESLPKLTEALPKGESLVIPDGGHAWPSAKPELFARHLTQLVLGQVPPEV